MRQAAPPEKLEEIWKSLEAQFGKFQAIQGIKVITVQGYWAGFVTCRFAGAVQTLRVVVDDEARIAGFFIEPPGAGGEWHPPPYADPSRFSERAVEVGSDPALPGHLSTPLGAGPFPAAVLVGGSGPNDQDETLGPNKIFKDLAWGLASRGIAVLRYDKRTLQAPEGVSSVREEYFDSFDQALALLAKDAQIDRARVVLIGHSEGAYLAPWMAEEHRSLAGIVLLSAPSRGLAGLIVEQEEYLVSLDPGNPVLAKGLVEAKRERDRADSPDLKPDELVFNTPGSYFLSLRDYHPIQVAARMDLPMLFVQGDRDYQVSAERDFKPWKEGLSKKKNATFHLYPGLNHLLIAGEGPPSPKDYAQVSHLDAQVVDLIATWILALKPASKA
jgi:alpha-beta hydrolase superfamily lysophospholipase